LLLARKSLLGFLAGGLGAAGVARSGHRLPVRREENALQANLPPLSCPLSGPGRAGTCAHEKPPYQPSASRRRGTVLIIPSRPRAQRTPMRPLLDRTRTPCSSRTPLPYSF